MKHTILHLIETAEPGGAERAVADLVSHIHPDRYRVLLGCSLDASWLLRMAKPRSVEVIQFRRNTVYDLRFLKEIFVAIQKQRVDLIHAHMFTMNFYGTLAAKLAARPVITTIQDRVHELEKSKRVRAYSIIGRLATRTIAVSEEIQEDLTNKVGIPVDKINLIHNGVDLERYRSVLDSTVAKERMGIPPRAPVVGTVGLLHPVKGHSYFLKAAAQVMKEFPGSYFVIVGDGLLMEELKTLTRSLGISHRVIFTGLQDEIPDVLSAMDVYVVSSVSEGLSLALLEAMASGRAVVATRVGGNTELITDAVNGFLVPPRDQTTLANKILSLLHHADLRGQFGEAARLVVSERFCLKRMVNAYQNLYEHILRLR